MMMTMILVLAPRKLVGTRHRLYRRVYTAPKATTITSLSRLATGHSQQLQQPLD
jgi:hypothetical protein